MLRLTRVRLFIFILVTVFWRIMLLILFYIRIRRVNNVEFRYWLVRFRLMDPRRFPRVNMVLLLILIILFRWDRALNVEVL